MADATAWAQGSCPVNIGFESGTFAGWKCYTGNTTYTGTTNKVTLNVNNPASTPIATRQEIKSSKTEKDPYGGFPVLAPNGSGHSVKLGNNDINAMAEGISYELDVPADVGEYTLTYYYAVVFEDPTHPAYQQPRFQAKLFDVAANAYVTCASFDFIATSGLPGFIASTVPGHSGAAVLYKNWSPVTIDLTAYLGKRMRLEFTTADCTQGGHFGYAYVDVNEQCTASITGNNNCENAGSVTLTGPSGYKNYTWYNSPSLTTAVGSGQTLTLTPAPPNGTKYYLHVEPYPGYGCDATYQTTLATYPFNLQIHNVTVCYPQAADLTASTVTTGSTPDLVYTYWRDPTGTVALANPSAVTQGGTYYIRGTSPNGCTDIRPVTVTINPQPALNVHAPAAVCLPATVDLTSAGIVAGSSPGLTYTYWYDAAATVPLPDPTAIAQSGTYYIRGVNSSGCSQIAPVNVVVGSVPVLTLHDPAPVCSPAAADLTAAAITQGSTAGLTLTYWKDAAATVPVNVANAVDAGGTYYVKGTNAAGCSDIKAVNVVVYAAPVLVVTDPAPICAQESFNLAAAAITAGSSPQVVLSYWKDAAATIAVPSPQAITVAGVYYIKATNPSGCSVVKPVTLLYSTPPDLKITNPAPVCSPATIDITSPLVTAGSSPNLAFTYWLDAGASVSLPDPRNAALGGTYYIKATNAAGCFTVKPVVLSVAPSPDLAVTDPSPVCSPATIDLTASVVSSGTSAGVTITYWKDAATTIPVPVANAVTQTGIYYVRAANAGGCATTRPVTVVIDVAPVLQITQPEPVCVPGSVRLNAAAITAGSTPQLTLTYWKDANATQSLTNPSAVTQSGTYYIRGVNSAGCSTIKPVVVTLLPPPSFTVTDPPTQYESQPVNLTTDQVAANPSSPLTYSYWKDQNALIPLPNPSTVGESGTYYIMGVNSSGCRLIKPVTVTLVPAPNILVPTAFTPGQVTNNRLYPFLPGIKTLVSFKIFNKWGNLVFESKDPSPDKGWDGYYKGSLHFMETYTWYVEGIDGMGKVIRKSGNTLLLR